MARTHIGTSGWNYKHWSNGIFYPEDLKPPEWLRFYSQRFDTVEINNSFYRLPEREVFSRWRKQVPAGFTFSVKASRFLTHIKRLKDPEEPLNRFFSRAVELKQTLGPVLFQLPPQMKCDLDRLYAFLSALRERTRRRRIRCVLEVRSADWLASSVFEMLHDYGVALCFADWDDLPVSEPITSDFVYIRRHSGRAGDGAYSRQELDADIRRIRAWNREGRDVYVYFNNDWKGYAVQNAEYVQTHLRKAGQ